MPIQAIKSFIKWESAGGVILMIAAVLALLAMNTGIEPLYRGFIDIPFTIGFDGFLLKKSFSHWVNDGLMAIFFLLVGLEIKREIVAGELSDRKKASLPVVAALGGMVAPALFFVLFNYGSPETMRGWAIPCATDIAFALAILTLLGKGAPSSLKTFLLSVAIIDDLGAILIIALFYSDPLNLVALAVATGITLVMIALHQKRVSRLSPFLFLGAILWIALLKSGLHATLAGVIIAFTIPLKGKDGSSPLEELEETLHPWVSFLIMPLFAFVNAGIPLSALSLNDLTSPLSKGIQAGLLMGKPVGILLFSWLAVKSRLARLPQGVTWGRMLGVAFLTGIGFTMSLFIGGMAFTETEQILQVRLSVLMASTFSALLGYGLLKTLISRPKG